MSTPSAGGFNPTGQAGAPKPKRARRVKRPVEGAELVKDQIVVAADGTAAVVNSKAGPLTWRDKVKEYYHTIIIFVTSLVALLTQITPLGNFLPEQYRGWLAAAVLIVGTILTFLKSNEVWVQKL